MSNDEWEPGDPLPTWVKWLLAASLLIVLVGILVVA